WPEGRDVAIARTCFEWVRDRIRHSYDYQLNPVTCRASEVLQHKTGYCYAKSHLLGALLRANGIPAGFCYQRLSVNETGAPYCLHGLNAVYLADFGWYRIDARGNKPGIDAQFTPPQEQLAFSIRLPGEAHFEAILSEPLPAVVQALQTYQTWDEVLANLPDCSPEIATTPEVSPSEASAGLSLEADDWPLRDL
ncbi:MAG: transglutaminase family protein, partial [Cyanobacteria bacterium J06623_5]